jgi:uncharacterized membrane protein
MGITKYIDFNYKKYNTVFNIAIIVLLFTHMFHLMDSKKKYLYLFYLGFIIGYILLLISEYQSNNNRINIILLIFRVSIILFLLPSFYHDLKDTLTGSKKKDLL